MNQASTLAIARLLDAFPQSSANPDLTLDTFDKTLHGLSDDVIEDTVKRFLAGEVEGQSVRFAPSVAEFNREARRIADARSYRDRPRLPPPVYERHAGGLRPFEVLQEKARQRFEDWDVFAKDVSYDQWRTMSKARQVPTGATWSPTLATIFVPRNTSSGE